jgi:Tol biopolymer transport system component
MTAIIREEPDSVAQLNPKVPAPVRWIVERCLAKDPDDRFGTTKDLAHDLADVRDHLSEASFSTSTTDMTAAAAEAVRAGRRRWMWPLVAAAVAAIVGIAAFAAGRRTGGIEPPSFRELTFQRGEIYSARFAPDGQTILYAAAWEGRPVEIFVSRLDSPEARPFGLKSADLFAVSSTGEMAVSLGRRFGGPFQRTGTLAQIGITGGGTPREVLEDVYWADWGPDGKSFAVVRAVGPRTRLEYPIGKVLYETDGWISNPRVSPTGDTIAFLDHPTVGDDGGAVALVDRTGKKKTLAADFSTEGGLAWSPNGNEVWFTAAETGGNRALYAVTRSGARRVLTRVTGNLTLQDVSRDGRALVSHDALRSGILGATATDQQERDLSWLDWSSVQDIAPDGSFFVFAESGEGGGPGYSAYLRRMDGSPPVRLGTGTPRSISPDGRWTLAVTLVPPKPQLSSLPTGAGESRVVAAGGLSVTSAVWFPDGKRVLLNASEGTGGTRLFLLENLEAKPRPVSPPGYRALQHGISPDGKVAAVVGPDRRRYLYPLGGGEPTAIQGLAPGEDPVGWTSDGRLLYVFRRGDYPGKVYRLEPSTGRRELWKVLTPPDPAGISSLSPPAVASDGKTYVYSYNRILSDLFLADGIR